MAAVKIAPERVVLTAAQAFSFHASDDAGQPVDVSWSLNPAVGSLVPAPAAAAQSRSVIYLAPSVLATAQTITLIASKDNDSATASIDLTPAVVIIPDKVELKAGESQKFVAVVAGPLAQSPQPSSSEQPPRDAEDAGKQTQGAAGGEPQEQPQDPAKKTQDSSASQPPPEANPQVPVPSEPPKTPPSAGPPDPAKTQAPPLPAAPPAPQVATPVLEWILSPGLGSIDQATGIYTAPEAIPDTATVTVIVRANGREGRSTINLVPFPWRGWSVNLLGAYILMVFCLVALLVGLWPAALPTPEVARADRLEAEKTLAEQTKTVENAEATLRTSSDLATQANAAAKADQTKAAEASAADARAKTDEEAAGRARDEKIRDTNDLTRKREIEDKVKNPQTETAFCSSISRETDLLLLVLLSGALGSFLHIARSYSDFFGNERLKSSWTWWYCMAPFTGAILALVFYAAVRGGFLAINAGSTTKASDLNPYSIASVAAFVGMFSKEATSKLGDLFKNFFQPATLNEAKDKLSDTSKSPPSPAPTGGSSGSSTTAAPAKPVDGAALTSSQPAGGK